MRRRELATAGLILAGVLWVGSARAAAAPAVGGGASPPGDEQSRPPSAAPPSFGERGQLILTADRLLPLASFTAQTITASQGATETKTSDRGASFALLVGREPGLGSMHTVPRLAVDFAVMDHLTVGTSFVVAFGLGGSHSEERTQNGGATARKHNAPEATILGFAPRVGYVVPLSARLAFWPRAGVAFYSARSKTEQSNDAGAVSTTTDSDTLFSFDVDPQLVWSPATGFFLHGGPIANLPLSGAHTSEFAQAGSAGTRTDDLSVSHVGVSVALGGWLSL